MIKLHSDKLFYDEGWNDCLAGVPCPPRNECTLDYWDGWHDCNDAPPEFKKPMKEEPE